MVSIMTTINYLWTKLCSMIYPKSNRAILYVRGPRAKLITELLCKVKSEDFNDSVMVCLTANLGINEIKKIEDAQFRNMILKKRIDLTVLMVKSGISAIVPFMTNRLLYNCIDRDYVDYVVNVIPKYLIDYEELYSDYLDTPSNPEPRAIWSLITQHYDEIKKYRRDLVMISHQEGKFHHDQ